MVLRDMVLAGLVCLGTGGLTTTRVLAQVGAGTLSGVVTSQDGAAAPGATVTAVASSTNRTRLTVSAHDGSFTFAALTPGTYVVRVELNGFRPIERSGVTVATGEPVRLDLQLQVGAVSEAVAVVGDASMLRSTSASLGQVIDNAKITALPLNGRNFITLAGLAPGVALPPNSSLPRINGGRPRTNEYLFDGISVLQPEPGQVAFFPNIDAIQEFRIESNSPPAEFGRFNGGVVNLTTKSGSNQVRGSAFEFLRHESLNARNYFASTNPVKPKYRRNQFGGVLGGPLQKDRTFFFLDYQGQRQTIGRTVISTVPTVLQRQGVFTEAIGGRVPAIYDPATTVGNTRTAFPNGAIPVTRFDPVAAALLARYPLPTSGGTANNYRRVDDETQDQDQFSLRLDRQFAGGDHVFGRLTRFAETFIPVTPLPDGSGVTTGTLGPQETISYSFASHYQDTLSSTMFNELRIGDTRRHVERSAATLAGSASSVLGIPGIPSTARFPNTLPTILITGYQQLGSPSNTATDFSTSVTQVADTFSWLKGRHSIKFGADVRWQRLNVIQPPAPTGAFTFSSLFTDLPGTANTGTPFASFLLGQVQQFSIDLQQAQIRNRAHFQEYFVQDDWRVSAGLTINAGLRYTLNFPSTEADNQTAVFNLQTQELEYAGQNGVPRAARQLHKNNFGPRLGLVQQLTEKMAVRAAYGLVWIEQAGITTPFTTPVFPFLQTVSQRTLDNIVPAFTLAQGPSVAPVGLTPDAGLGQGVFAVDRDLGSGYVQQWSASFQRDLTSNLTTEIAYLGSKITHVGIPDSNVNQLSADQLALGSTLTQRVANPYFGIIPRSSSLGDPTIPLAQLLKPYPQYTTVSLYRNNVGNTIYKGVSVLLQQRLSHGLSYLVAYTRSKLMDDASSVFDASILTGPIANYPVADSYNRKLERDYSTGDIPHVFAASATWDLPFGRGRRPVPSWLGAFVNDWSLSGILTLQSGVPIAVTQSTNDNAFAGFGVQRPNLIGDPALPADQRTVGRWFNTAAFATAPQFTLGSATRNPVRGPGFRNLDLALARRVPLQATRALELRAEAFNITNTPALGAPNGTFGSAAFGSITTALDPRVVQLAVKFLF
ncbi:MAG: TonB-dependent receptor [Vicinamibacterales bacterium]